MSQSMYGRRHDDEPEVNYASEHLDFKIMCLTFTVLVFWCCVFVAIYFFGFIKVVTVASVLVVVVLVGLMIIGMYREARRNK